MKTLHRYLSLQVIASLALTVAVFTFVLLLGNILKEVLRLLMNGEVRVSIVLEAIGLLIPFVLVYALPIGFITATLLAFGRFSADHELTAARASGVSLLSLATPILLLSIACCALCAWINTDLGPRSRAQYTALLDQAQTEISPANLPTGRTIDFPGYSLYVTHNDNGYVENVEVISNNPALRMTILASSGKIGSIVSNQFMLTLTNITIVTAFTNGSTRTQYLPQWAQPISLNRATNKLFKPKISDMSLDQLQAVLREREQVLANLPAPTNYSSVAWRAQVKIAEKLVQQVRSQIHQELAFSFACFGFALVGIPLGIRVHRRETNMGIVKALALVIVYYSFVILGNSLSSRPELFPHLIFWVPNFIFQAVGAVLLWRANRGV